VNGVNSVSNNFAEQFEDARPGLPGAGLDWLDALRGTAMERFGEAGFPTPRMESWKYTNLSRLSRIEFPAEISEPDAKSADIARWLMADADCHRLVFIDGRYSADQSAIGDLPKGVVLSRLADIIDDDPDTLRDVLAATDPEDGDGLLALNTALLRDGMVLRIDAGVELTRPVQLVHFATSDDATHPRHLVTLGENSRATLLECYVGATNAKNWTNSVMTIDAAAGAKLDHVRLQLEGEDAYHVGLTRLNIARDSAYLGVALSVGAKLSRNEFRAALNGTGADCRIAGGALVRDRQHADITTEIVQECS
jgi:Fe-S cluster assembly protein SufD